MEKNIIIKGARENNLKNIDLEIPRNKFVVFTGVSGSGKSTLAFDTIFAEGQRKFVESLSSYARQFLGQVNKPDIDVIEGLSPSISIEQKTTSQNPRSTVGTVTEIYDYLRILFANIGIPFCPKCNKEISAMSIDQIIDKVKLIGNGEKIIIQAPIIRGQKGMHEKLLESLKKLGYLRVEIDGNEYLLDEEIHLDKNIKHYINVIVDRIILKNENESRLSEAIGSALKLSNGLVYVLHNNKKTSFSNNFACEDCGFSYEEITPRLFSFNSPVGACPECFGLGIKRKIDEKLVIKDYNKSINEGALIVSGWNLDSSSNALANFNALSKKFNFSLDTKIKDLPKDILKILLYGTDEEITFTYKSQKINTVYKSKFEGVITNLERRFRETSSDYVKQEISKYMIESHCDCCEGKRLNQKALNVRINQKNITEVTDLCIDDLVEFLGNLQLNTTELQIAKPVLKEINSRCNFLQNVGLNYLTLSRMAGTLSGGEAQRIRLATQIGSGLMGVLYILDEPSIGLHQRDNEKLLLSLKHLRDLGNSLIVVEHDEETMREADFIVDIGPKAGVHGGEVVAKGTVQDIINSENSITGKYLSGEYKIEIPYERRKITDEFISVIGAKQNNLKNISIDFPTKVFTCVTGVSGSGKSSLINEILVPTLMNRLNTNSKQIEGKYDEINIPNSIDKIICIDQSPIGRTPRSNPATYTGLFTPIRELFAQVELSKERGYNAGKFSFNIKGGRCEACQGDGIKTIEMYFLPDVYVPCEVCGGKRYMRETLDVKYKNKNIYDILEMTIEDALEFFQNIPQIRTKVQALYDVGLGYIKLGQPATTLSGGEAQRVKLATELCKRSTGNTVYILDEPTTGLHTHDVKKLLNILQTLVSSGNTVIVIEHNLDVIKVADYIIDLGPEGGNNGGTIVAKGTPEEVAKNEFSYTGKYLNKILNN